MAIFRFKLLSPQGALEKGIIELPFNDSLAAMRYLERRGGVALEVTPMPSFLEGVMIWWRTKFGGIERPDIAEFFNNLAMLARAGVPILSALEEIGDEIKKPALKMVVKFMCTDIESGQTFSEAIDKHERVFAPVLLQMIHIGEETGKLDEMLKKCSEHVQHIHEIISATKKAMMYPGFLSAVVVGAICFWFGVVVPQMVGLFKDLGVALPWATLMIIAVSDWFTSSGPWVALWIVVGVIVSKVLRGTWTAYRYWTDALILRTPIAGMIVDASIVARICEFLGILIAAGIGVLRTLEIITDSTTNLVYVRRMKGVQEAIKSGNTLTAALRQHEALHPFALRMILVGEQTGRLEEQTSYVADVYRSKLKGLVDTLAKSLEPILLVVVGLVFAVIMAGLLLPIYDLIGKVGK